MVKTEKEIKDIILAWTVRRRILLVQDSIDDLAKEIVRQEAIKRPKWAVGQVWRETGLLEDTCEHGIGHPNLDWLRNNDPYDRKYWSIHGCDGCCKSDKDAKYV